MQFDIAWRFCNVFIDFMLKGKRYIYCTNLFSPPNDYEKNDNIIV